VKQKPGEGGGGGVEARDFTVSEGHGHPLVILNHHYTTWAVLNMGICMHKSLTTCLVQGNRVVCRPFENLKYISRMPIEPR